MISADTSIQHATETNLNLSSIGITSNLADQFSPEFIESDFVLVKKSQLELLQEKVFIQEKAISELEERISLYVVDGKKIFRYKEESEFNRNKILELEKENLKNWKAHLIELTASKKEKEILANKINDLLAKSEWNLFWNVLTGIGLVFIGIGAFMLGIKK